ncbi:MAG TPA: hypothetical protein VN256_11935 [Pyrinomonadaceae bacterium]|nr:hypothetical protein [Pyrinomonadaceae bacterium]
MIGATYYFDLQGKLNIYAFLVKGITLYVNYWDGSQWKWANQGKPADTGVLQTPGVITHVDSVSRRQLVYAFVRGNNGNLYVNYWDGSKWQWANQGKPSGTDVGSAPSALTYFEGKDRIYAFTSGEDGKFYANYWDGTKWQWVELPAGGSIPGATWFRDPASLKRRIYVFGLVQNWVTELESETSISINEWDGTKWQGALQPSAPPHGTAGYQHPAAISYLEAGKPRVYGFVNSAGFLTVYYWDGTKWQWADQGKPPGTQVWSAEVSSVTYTSASGKQWIHAFVTGEDHKLYMNFWDGTKWQWVGYGKPPTVLQISNPTAITFRDATGKQQIYVFVMGSDGNVYVNYGDISNRTWANQGAP